MKVACITPLKEEAGAVWRGWSLRGCGELQGRPIAFDDAVFAVASGMGACRVRNAVELVRRLYSPECFLLFGFCCGLSADTRPGDLILDSRSSPSLRNAVEGLSLPLRTTQLANIPLLRTAQQKAEFARKEGPSLAGDMETEAFFEALEGSPGLALRAVSDGHEQDLPFDFQRFLDGNGFPDSRAVALAALKAPTKLPGLISLASGSRRAQSALESVSSELSLLFRELYPVQ